ncbi:MAG: TonB-dependent receptor domain-containing protein [Hyphomicrobiales bacterium]
MKRILFTSLILLIFKLNSFGQERYIQVLDADSETPIIFAHTELLDLISGTKEYQVTDDYGKILNTAKSKSKLTVSYMGYNILVDTIFPNTDKIIYMHPSSKVLDEVVVTGQYVPEGTDKSIYQIEVIDNRKIEAKASQNLQDVLSSSLNFRFQNGGPFGTRALLNGIGGENVKILVDGVPQVGRLNGELDLSQINLNNVERIEIVEGPMSVQYGTNALAGVVNIFTKDYIKDKFLANVNTYYESVGQYNIDGSLGYMKNKKTYLLNFGRQYFDGYTVSDTSRIQTWKPKRTYFTDFKYKRRIGTANLKFFAGYYDEKLLDKGAYNYVAYPDDNVFYPVARDGYFSTKRAKSNLSFTGVVGNDNYVDLLAAYTHYNRQKEYKIKNLTTGDSKSSTDPADTDTTKINSWVFRGTWSKFRPNDHKFNFQLGYEINLESTTGKKIDDGEKSIQDYAVFGSMKYLPWKWFTFQPGVRYSYNSVYKAPITPSFNVKINPLDNIIIRASYANGFRAPSIKELYMEFVDVNHRIFGNKELEAETSNSYRLSLVYNFMNSDKVVFKLEPSFFYNDIQNKISLLNKINPDDLQSSFYAYDNIDNFKSIGGNLNFSYLLHDNFSLALGAGYTGINQKFRASKDHDKAYNFYPEVTVNANWLIIPWNTELNFNYKYTGEIPNVVVDPEGVLEEYTQEDYHTLDVSAKKPFFDNKLSLTIGGKNLFNVTNVTGGNEVGGVHLGGTSSVPISWGRTFFVALSYNLNR